MKSTAASSMRWPGPWSLPALRGAVAIAFAALALLWPGMTLFVLAVMWGAYALVDGICSFVHAWRLRRHGEGRWTPALIGLLGVGAGVAVLAWPPVAMLSLIGLFALWAMLAGAAQLAAALRLRRAAAGGRWLLALAGLLTLAFGLFVVAWPRPGVLVVMWAMAAQAMASGLLLLALAADLRRQRLRPLAAGPRPARAAPAPVAQEAQEAAKEAAAIAT